MITNIKAINKVSIIKTTEHERGILYFSNLVTSGLNRCATKTDIRHGTIIGRIKNNAPIMKSSTQQIVI
ncbi:hypothetical protein wHmcTK_06110 [Wolbachia pipientis]|nr:hypothetical protein wHmt_06250 [Wolbachia pipientis]BDG77527.1 hypothetical protein wHmc_06590 [Wolbachia pipientis]